MVGIDAGDGHRWLLVGIALVSLAFVAVVVAPPGLLPSQGCTPSVAFPNAVVDATVTDVDGEYRVNLTHEGLSEVPAADLYVTTTDWNRTLDELESWNDSDPNFSIGDSIVLEHRTRGERIGLTWINASFEGDPMACGEPRRRAQYVDMVVGNESTYPKTPSNGFWPPQGGESAAGV